MRWGLRWLLFITAFLLLNLDVSNGQLHSRLKKSRSRLELEKLITSANQKLLIQNEVSNKQHAETAAVEERTSSAEGKSSNNS